MDHLRLFESLPFDPEDIDLMAWLMPLAFILGGIVVGLILENIVLSRIRKYAYSSKWPVANIIPDALRGMFLLWTILAGMYEAAFSIPGSNAIQDHIHQLISIVFIFSIVMVVARIATESIRIYIQRIAEVLASTTIFILFTQIIIYMLGVLVILQTLGISIIPILTALGVGGLAISLALQDTLANFFSGIHIVLSRQIRVGDYIKLDSGEEGYVVDISWRSTSIREITQNLVIVPNTKLASSIIVNYHKPLQELYVRLQVGVSYREDLKHVERVTLEVTEQVLKAFYKDPPSLEPFVRFHTFNDFSIDYYVMFPIKEYTDRYPLHHHFVQQLHDRFNREGITIPFPIRTLDFPGELPEVRTRVSSATGASKD